MGGIFHPSAQYRYPDDMSGLANALIAAAYRREQQRMNEMALRAASEDRQAMAEERRQRTQNERFQNDLAIANLEQSAAANTPRSAAPTVPLVRQMPILNEETGGLSPDEAAYIGGDTQVPKEFTEVRPPGRAPIKVPLRYQEDNPDWTVLTPEAWKTLPAFYQGIWKPGQRLRSRDVGEVGQKILADSIAKSKKVPMYDTEAKADVMVPQSAVDADVNNRYRPPQEGRIATDARVRELAGDAAAAKAETAREKAAAAKAKADDEATNLTDAADRIARGEPAANVGSKYRDQAVAKARAQGARVYTTQQQKDKVVTLESIKDDIVKLRDLLKDPEVAQYVGPGAGRVTGIAQHMPDLPLIGPDIPEKVLEARRLMMNLQDRTLRQRSGAQINPKEMKRITSFTVDPNWRMDRNLVNVEGMLRETDSIIQGELGGEAAPRGASPPAAAPKVTISPAGESVLKKYGF